jgi:hypothetical protein
MGFGFYMFGLYRLFRFDTPQPAAESFILNRFLSSAGSEIKRGLTIIQILNTRLQKAKIPLEQVDIRCIQHYFSYCIRGDEMIK